MRGEKSNTERHKPVIIFYLPIAHFTVASQRTFVRLLHYESTLVTPSSYIKFQISGLNSKQPWLFHLQLTLDCLCQLLLGYYAPLTCRKCVLYNQRPNWKTKRNKPFDNLASQHGTVFHTLNLDAGLKLCQQTGQLPRQSLNKKGEIFSGLWWIW